MNIKSHSVHLWTLYLLGISLSTGTAIPLLGCAAQEPRHGEAQQPSLAPTTNTEGSQENETETVSNIEEASNTHSDDETGTDAAVETDTSTENETVAPTETETSAEENTENACIHPFGAPMTSPTQCDVVMADCGTPPDGVIDLEIEERFHIFLPTTVDGLEATQFRARPGGPLQAHPVYYEAGTTDARVFTYVDGLSHGSANYEITIWYGEEQSVTRAYCLTFAIH